MQRLIFAHRPAEQDHRACVRLVHHHPDASAPATRCSCATCSNDPTSWAFDLSYLMYGARVLHGRRLHAVARRPRARRHVLPQVAPSARRRASNWSLYVLFFFPGILALVVAGWGYGFESMRMREVSVNSPAGVPIWPLKMMISVGASLIALQGFAEVLRCLQCLRDGQLAAAPARRGGTREADPASRQRASGEAEGARVMSDPVVALMMLGHPGLRDHDRVSGRLHADGAGRGVRLLRLLPAAPGILRQPRLLPADAEHLHGAQQRRAGVDPAVPA